MELNLLDRRDHTGMYSKAGRVAVERYTILQHTDEILNPTKHPNHSSSLPSLKQLDLNLTNRQDNNNTTAKLGMTLLLQKEQSEKNITNNTIHNYNKTISEISDRRKKTQKKDQPWTKIVSRNKREEILKAKQAGPTNRNYNPKYTLVQRSPGVYVDFKKSELRTVKSEENLLRHGSTKKNENNPNDEINENKHNNNRSLDRIKSLDLYDSLAVSQLTENPGAKKKLGPVAFDLQLSRDDLEKIAQKNKKDNPERFLCVDMPSNLSSNKKVVIPNLAKNKGRGDAEFLPKLQTCPTYEPNYDHVQKRLDKGLHVLDKMLPRISLEKKNTIVHETIFYPTELVDTTKSVILPKIVSPTFEKMLARDINTDSKFPGYLQGVSSRWSMQLINEKSLYQNNYKEGRFQTNVSCFETSLIKDKDSSMAQ